MASGRAPARTVEEALTEIYKELETSGATWLLTSIDVCHTQLGVAAVGIFSVYESRLQSAYGWAKPFREVQRLLAPNEAEEFENLRLAVNVLKHGNGDSHTKLLARADRLPFKVQGTLGSLYEEGDVCPPSDLILVTVGFLERCCDLIEKSWVAVKVSN